MRMQPLRWWTGPQLTELAARFEHVTQEWCTAWGLPAPVALVCMRAHECAGAQAEDWRLWAAQGERQVLLRSKETPAAQLLSALFKPAAKAGECAHDSMASQLAQQAWCALQAAWRGVCGIAPVAQMDEAATAPADSRAWSDAVVLGFDGWVLDLQLYLNPACASELMHMPPRFQLPAASQPPLTDFFDALQDASLPLRVALSDVEIDIGSLQNLALGDVIRLPHLLDAALNVHVGDDIVCTAYLGQRQGRRAVELQRSLPELIPSKQEHP